MDGATLVNVVILSGLVGFAVYCGSHALHVWRARNLAVSAASGGETGAKARRSLASTALVAAGVLSILTAYVVRLTVAREGLVLGEGLYALRVPRELKVTRLAAGPDVAAGEEVARLSSPESVAAVAALELKAKRLEADEQIVQRESPPLDAELVRRHHDLVTERRHLEASRDQLVPARDVVDRDRDREASAHRARGEQLAADLARNRQELAQARARAKAVEEEFVRLRELAATSASTARELSDAEAEATVAAVEVKKLKEQEGSLLARKEQADRDLARVEQRAAAQAASLDRDLRRVRERLAVLPGEQARLEKDLAAEVARAEERKRAKLEQVRLELRECQEELAGLRGALSVAAPFDGRVAYRDPAPASATEDAPVCVLAPADAFRLKLRLPSGEASSLRRAGAVRLELAPRTAAGQTGAPRELPRLERR